MLVFYLTIYRSFIQIIEETISFIGPMEIYLQVPGQKFCTNFASFSITIYTI